MQRVRTGLTGLAIVFLLVLIASALLRPERAAPAGSANAETLSVLGVAPSTGDAVPPGMPKRQPAEAPVSAPARQAATPI